MIKPDTDEQKKFGNVAIPIFFGFVALVVLYCASLESPAHRHYNSADAKEANHTYEDSKSVSKLPVNVDINTKTTKEYTDKEKESFAASRSDLAAQWAMAHYTYIGLVIGLIGICFLIWTIIETRNAALFAERTLQETKINSRRELRAYLKVEVDIEKCL